MAVIPAIKGLTVTVKVDGKTATEYPTPPDFDPQQFFNPDVRSNYCYIESTTGLSFAVEAVTTAAFKATPPYNDLILEVWVDGKWANVDDALTSTIRHDIKVARSMGTIQARLHLAWGREVGKHVSGNRQKFSTNSDALKLAEKSMKGRELTHGTTLSNDYTLQKAFPPVKSRKECKFAEFWFFYRSRGALHREMILPPSPSPPSSLFSVKKEERKRPVDLMTLDRKPSQNDVKPKKLKSCDEPDIVDLTGIAPFRSDRLKSQSQDTKFKREPEVIDLTGL
ncbi:hypothetical protein CDD80_3813 [Ophiocordyceps camponoti-rufipedis]|uniref:DUF7918 domain-containing protein n=1 Tax=Ophiocordyceps camponoti-rufipedis TaxID=2004952 RepID=A0A2C5XIC2_9HYPO|nr:hypothetical protein CDD80_3813 [Ophiocordyceps camponoti-rufipedis]